MPPRRPPAGAVGGRAAGCGGSGRRGPQRRDRVRAVAAGGNQRGPSAAVVGRPRAALRVGKRPKRRKPIPRWGRGRAAGCRRRSPASGSGDRTQRSWSDWFSGPLEGQVEGTAARKPIPAQVDDLRAASRARGSVAKASGGLRNMLRENWSVSRMKAKRSTCPSVRQWASRPARASSQSPPKRFADRPVERGAAAVPARRPDLARADDILRCHGIPPRRSGDPATVRGERAR